MKRGQLQHCVVLTLLKMRAVCDSGQSAGHYHTNHIRAKGGGDIRDRPKGVFINESEAADTRCKQDPSPLKEDTCTHKHKMFCCKK